jgi:hypothetical protein
MVRRHLLDDPDERILRWGWLIWFAWSVVAGALLLDDFKAGRLAIGIVLSAPFWALWLLWPLYRGAAGALRRYSASRWADWHGQYYEFDGRQVRVLFGDDGAVWFVADDVFAALKLEGRQRDPERARVIAGRDGLSFPPGEHVLAFSETGLRAWLERRTDTEANRFANWVDKQVIDPFRRRQQLGS